VTNIDTPHSTGSANDVGAAQKSIGYASNQVVNKDSRFFSWPVLAIGISLLCTVAWCGFLTWLIVMV
jgi:hypothetical protein